MNYYYQQKVWMSLTNIMLGKRNQMQDMYKFVFEFHINLYIDDI